MPRRSRTSVLFALVAVAALALVALRFGVAAEPVLWCAPAVVLLLPLLGGWFVGEQRLVARRRRLLPRTGRALPVASRGASRRAGVSGGRLIACALAKRGPPACAGA